MISEELSVHGAVWVLEVDPPEKGDSTWRDLDHRKGNGAG